MPDSPEKEVALIVGAGEGLSASVARLCAAEDMAVAIAASSATEASRQCHPSGHVASAAASTSVTQTS